MNHPIVLGTAGHIDHGKTSLVRALTGIDTDRLPVEKQRGITTELGFAHLELGGRRVAMVDVPGHERFVKAMVAGAGGLDVALMVIAADEGAMPQTREHLDICDLLGVRCGVVALSKSDLVDAEWIEMVTQELRGALAHTFLATAPIIPVSARTGAGLGELTATLTKMIRDLPPRDATGVFRLPIDRVFTVKGFGTVVTGTVASGSVAVGDEVAILSSGRASRVRGLEVHAESAKVAVAGTRAAINLLGVAAEDIARGDVVAHPSQVKPSHILDVQFRYLRAASSPLPRRSRILLHHGTTAVMARLTLVDREALAPGATAPAQIRLDATTPVAALPGDQFIARGFAPLADYGTTLGGGTIVRVLAAKARRTDHGAAVDKLVSATTRDRIVDEIRIAGAAGRTSPELVARTGTGAIGLAAYLEELVATGELMAVGEGASAAYFHGDTVATLEQSILERARAAAADASTTRREEVRSHLPTSLPLRAFDRIIDGLVRRGVLAAKDETLAPVTAPRPPAPVDPIEQKVTAAFARWGVAPPRPADVAQELALPAAAAKQTLDRLLTKKTLVKVKPDYYVDAAVIATLRQRLSDHLTAHGQITPGEWKELTGATRKHSIPLAEYFDGERLTLRVGDIRKRRG